MKNELDIKKEFEILKKKLEQGKYQTVINECKKLLKTNKHEIFFNFLCISYQNLGRLDDAISTMNDALKTNPRNSNFLNNLGLSYFKKIEYKKAEKYYYLGLKENENNLQLLNNLANLKRETYQIDMALDIFKKILSMQKDVIPVHINLAGIYQGLNQKENSKKHCLEVLKLNPEITLADRMLSQVSKYEKNNAHLVKMENKLKEKNLTDDQKIHLYFGVFKAYNDIGNYKKGYESLEKGNQLLKKNFKYQIKEDEVKFKELKKKFINIYSQKSIKNQRKILFIVGMPRSGTTLVEQILSSHRDVFGGGELVYFQSIMNEILTDENSNNLDFIQKKYSNYISQLDSSNKVFTDKSLLNFHYIGFIKKALPNSKIINCIRNPIDNCWSIFKHFFPSNIRFVNNLNDISDYYKLYLNELNYWKESFDQEIFDLNYEDLVGKPKDQIKKLLDFCELDWDDNCLSHHKNPRIIKTLSFSQANRPIYKSGIMSYKKYEKYLQNLIKNFS